MEVISAEGKRVRDILAKAEEILEDLDRQFCEKTKLNKVDTAFFLLFSLALYGIRQMNRKNKGVQTCTPLFFIKFY